MTRFQTPITLGYDKHACKMGPFLSLRAFPTYSSSKIILNNESPVDSQDLDSTSNLALRGHGSLEAVDFLGGHQSRICIDTWCTHLRSEPAGSQSRNIRQYHVRPMLTSPAQYATFAIICDRDARSRAYCSRAAFRVTALGLSQCDLRSC